MTIKLYPHQVSIKNEVRAAFGKTRYVLMQAVTGFGKTNIAASMIADAYHKGSSVWFIVPRRELARQTANTLANWNTPFSYIMANQPYNPFARIQVVSLQTVVQRLPRLKAPKFAMIDETHVAGAGMDQLIGWLKAAGTYILGMSGTPWRLDGVGLGKYYDEMVCGPSVSWLIEHGFLSQYKAYAPSQVDLSRIRKSDGDYSRGQLADFMESNNVLIGDAVRHYRGNAMGRLNLVYATSRRHSEMIAEQFRNDGIPAMHMDGETPDDERRRIIRAFAMRQILVLSTVDIATYGFDLAANAGMDVTIEAMSDLRPTKSLALQLQKLRRVLRRKDYPAIIHDHASNLREHGLPDSERSWTLSDRQKASKSEAGSETAIETRQCDSCFYVHKPAPQCTSCGKVYEIQYREVKQVEGDLAEITAADIEKMQRRQEQGMAKTKEELMKVFMARGSTPRNALIRATKIVQAREAKARTQEQIT